MAMLTANDAVLIESAIDYYDRDASRFASRYETVSFAQVHPVLLPFLPRAGRSALDIGAGSGRDARALAALGLRVTAVEPAENLRRAAQSLTNGDDVRWIDDRLPDLATLSGERFTFILCSAVLMLLPGRAMVAGLARMADLLEADGRLAISVRDPVAGGPDDLVHALSDADLAATTAQAGLTLIEQRNMTDALGRATHRWRYSLFER
jgi:SAM-dependent methyltransferase